MTEDSLTRLMAAARLLPPTTQQWLAEFAEERLTRRVSFTEFCEAMRKRGVNDRPARILWSKLTGTNFATSPEIRFAPRTLAELLTHRGKARLDAVTADTWVKFQEWLEGMME